MVAVFVGAVLSATCFPADFYVAPTGNDTNLGTIDQPFATLQRALEATRRSGATTNKNILVRGGKYYNVSLILEGLYDSNLRIEAAPGEAPVLYGGQPLTNWQKVNDVLYAAALPEFPQSVVAASSVKQWLVRMLLVNGEAAPRSKYPATGKLTYLNQTGSTLLQYRTNDLGGWLVISNAEVRIDHSWNESTVAIVSNNVETATLTLAPSPQYGLGYAGVRTYTVWNIAEGVTGPGQWYHDRPAGRIVYWPKAGQSAESMECIVPTTSKILWLKGGLTPLTNVVIRGLSIAVTTVPVVAGGSYAGAYDGAISFQWTRNCLLDGLSVGPVAGQAISSQGMPSLGMRIQNCTVFSCGAGGIYANYTTNSLVLNNFVHDVGLMFPAGAGIRGGREGSLAVFNETRRCAGAGIAVDYGNNSTIASNYLTACMQSLRDGGAIYSGGCRNVTIRNNFITDIAGPNRADFSGSDPRDFFLMGIYLDQGSLDSLVEYNVVYNVPYSMMLHIATNCTAHHNFFISSGDLQFLLPGANACKVEKNIFWAGTNVVVQNPASVAVWSNNVFGSRTKTLSYGMSGAANVVPVGATIGDPMFVTNSSSDFRLKPESPCVPLGISPLYVNHVGLISNHYVLPPTSIRVKKTSY